MNKRLGPSAAAVICFAITFASVGRVSAADRAKSPQFHSPAEAISAAETAYGHRKYRTYFDCFSPDGQKQVVDFMVQMLTTSQDEGAGATTASAPSSAQAEHEKKVAALFHKYGIPDTKKHNGETDEQRTGRLAHQVRDRRGFVSEACAMLIPASDSSTIKGELRDVKISNQTAHATYAVKGADGTAMTQEVDFQMVDGSWKIAKFIFFVHALGNGK